LIQTAVSVEAEEAARQPPRPAANSSLPPIGAGWPAWSLMGEDLPNVTGPIHSMLLSLQQTLKSDSYEEKESPQDSIEVTSERELHYPLRHTGASLRLAERLPVNSSVRDVTKWDVILFFATISVPFLVAGARRWMEWQESKEYIKAGGPGLKRSDSYYMEENRGEETGKLHKFLHRLDDSDEPPEGTTLKNVLSGVVVALACLPEAVSLSLIVGVSPLNGVWSGAVMNLCSAVVGGRPGLVSFSSAAYAVVLVDITKDPQLGIGVMGVAVIISGMIQAFIGSLRISRFASLIPQPVLLGIINGLAIVTACSQIDHFRRGGAGTSFVNDDELMGMLLTALVSFAVAWLWPRMPVVGPLVPGTFVGVIVAVVFSLHVSPFPTRTLEQVSGRRLFRGGLENTLPPWNFPPLEVEWPDKYMWHKAASTGVRLAAVGLVESLVALMILDQVTETRGSTTRECYGQSLGNVLCGILGLQGGCAVIGQSLINVSSGGRGRLSGISTSCFLFLIVAWLGPNISRLPAAPFIGLMTLVALNTFSWGMVGTIRRAGVDSMEGMVIMCVMMATVFLDLAVALVVGVIISALMFAWNVSTKVQLEIYVDRVLDSRSFVLHSPLFFGSAEDFVRQVRLAEIPQKQVVLDFSHGSVLDHTGAEAIAKITQRLQRAGKHVELIGLNVDAKEIMGCAMALPGD